MSGRVFRSAQLWLSFGKHKDGSSRDEPYEMCAKNGRVTIPEGAAGTDSQGRSTYLMIGRENGDNCALFLEGDKISFIDETTQTRILFDGSGIKILRGSDDNMEYYDLPIKEAPAIT